MSTNIQQETMSFAQIAATLATPSTSGYDAVVSLAQQQLDQFLFSTYAAQNHAQVAVSGLSPVEDGIYDAFSMRVTPPMPQFAGDQAQLSYQVYAGCLFQINASGNPNYMVDYGSSGSTLVGSYPLTTAQGADNSGSVVIDFSQTKDLTGQWTGQLAGVLPGSQEAQEIFSAIGGYFSSNPLVYTLGSVNTSGTLAALTPTSFTFATQNAVNNPGSNLMLLITTDGSAGGNPPSADIIPSGSSVGVLVSNRAMFQEVIPDLMNQATKAQNGNFTYQTIGASSAYQTVSTAGGLDVGTIQEGNAQQGGVWSSDADYNPVDLIVPLSGMTMTPGSSGMGFSWTSDWNQLWTSITYTNAFNSVIENCNLETVGLQVISTALLTPTVTSATNDTVTFSGSFTSSTAPTTNFSIWQKLFEADVDLTSSITDPINNALGTWLNNLDLPQVSTFLIDNLLFPASGLVAINNAAIPCDFYTAGNIESPLSLSPSVSSLSAGQSVTLSLNQAVAQVEWSVTPPIGTVTNGVYTAPSQIAAPSRVVVQALNAGDLQQVAYALVELTPTLAALTITPANVTLAAPGAPFQLQAIDANGQVDPNATFTASVGVAKKNMEGDWFYTPPGSVSAPTPVTITAQSSAGTATATWNVVPVDEAFNVTCPVTSLSAGQSAVLTATTSLGIPQALWCMMPEAGSVIATGLMTAQYTAPATITSAQTVTLCGFGGNAATALGCATVSINLTPG